jgi:pyrimidine-nucleoside phosphorylase
MSKKMAEGIDALVLDVKVGSGAFMKRIEDARTLARTMIDIGSEMGREVVALLTDMEQPLGAAVGNALEVIEAVEMLHGRGPEDYREVTLALTAEMLVVGGVAADTQEARSRLQRVIDDGSAFRKFQQIIEAQGGDPRAIEDYSRLPTAAQTLDVTATGTGWVVGIDTEGVGLAGVALGAGRERTDSIIDPGVGFTLLVKEGAHVEAGQPLVRIHHNGGLRVPEVQYRLQRAIRVGDIQPASRPLVRERLSAADR